MCLRIFLHIFFLSSLTYEQEFDLENIFDLQRKFLSERSKNNVSATRIKLLDKMLDGDKIVVDDVVHYSVSNHPKLSKVKTFENEFKNVIAMNGVKYVYNRDKIWRTWEKVSADKDAKIVHYRYISPVDCKSNCDLLGYWLIETSIPPCPYEIFSTDKDKVCALNISTYHNSTKCSSNLLSVLMATCDNPIETKWIIEKKYGKKNETFPAAICGEKMYCRITTLYKINPDSISFQILSETNNILFSRIMKNGGKNYACVEKCGKYDPDTSKTVKNEPLKVNMLKKLQKREDNRRIRSNSVGFFIHDVVRMKTTHRPSCKKLEHNHSIDESEDEGYYFV